MIRLSILSLLILTFFITTFSFAKFTTSSHHLSPRATLSAPSNSKISWNVSGKRASLGNSTKTISHYTLAKSGTITQTHFNTCVTKCQTLSNSCTFAQLFRLSDSNLASVVCSLHGSYVNSTDATIATGGKTMGGRVVMTYGIRILSSKSTSSTTTSRKSTIISSEKKTTTSSTRKSITTTSSTKKHSSTSSTKRHSSISSTKKHSSTSSTRKNSSTSSTRKHSSTSSTKITSSHKTKSSTRATITSTSSSKVKSTTSKTTTPSSKTSTKASSTLTSAISRSSSTSASTSKSSSSNSASPTDAASTNSTGPTFPASPKGGRLVQLAPCLNTFATVPMFVNNQYNKSTTDSAYIVQHGHERDFATYFSTVYKTIGTKGIIIAPNSYITTDPVAPSSWYQPDLNLAWEDDTGTWAIGEDAVAPTNGTNGLNGTFCSSFDTYDAILKYLSDTSLFPNLAKVYFVSHSGGANMVSRYSQLYNGIHPFAIRYVIANAANQAYFTNARPMDPANFTSCQNMNNYPYQLVANGMPRYVANHFTTALDLFKRWISRDVVFLTGNLDTEMAYPGGVENCQSQAQGGRDRRDRMYAYWAYQNIIAGTNNNVSAFYGYDELLENGATVLYSGATLNHQNCVVDGVGHSASGMFSSSCGIAAMKNATLPAGAPPTDPEPTSTPLSSSSSTASTSASSSTPTTSDSDSSTVTDGAISTSTFTESTSTVTDATPTSTDTNDGF